MFYTFHHSLSRMFNKLVKGGDDFGVSTDADKGVYSGSIKDRIMNKFFIQNLSFFTDF